MKKPIAKLTLHRETIKTLDNDDLKRVVGGGENCPDITRLVSGCTTDPVVAFVQSPATKNV